MDSCDSKGRSSRFDEKIVVLSVKLLCVQFA